MAPGACNRQWTTWSRTAQPLLMAAVAVVVSSGLGACRGPEPSPESPPPPPPARAQPLAKGAPPKDRVQPEHLRPRAQHSVDAAILLDGELPDHVEEGKLEEVRLVPQKGAASDAVAVLDFQTPRPLDGSGRTLDSLLNEDLELGPGIHRVVVIGATSDAVLYQSHPFSYGVRESAVDDLPPCVLYRPGGTYNGPAAADAIEIMALALSDDVVRFRYGMTGPGIQEEVEADAGRLVVAERVGSGDYLVNAECLGRGGESLGRLERTITVNRDVLPEESD